jgi:hypothetical protein
MRASRLNDGCIAEPTLVTCVIVGKADGIKRDAQSSGPLSTSKD